jgi:hypothetical protein
LSDETRLPTPTELHQFTVTQALSGSAEIFRRLSRITVTALNPASEPHRRKRRHLDTLSEAIPSTHS